MASIGEIYATLGLDTREFEAGSRRARATLQHIGRDLRTATNRAGKFSVAMGAAGAALAIAFGRQQLKSIDNLAKLSDQLQVATEDLQGLQRAGELTGVGAEGINSALEAMTKRVGEAAQGTGRAKDAIEQLGLSVDDLARMSPDEQFYSIAGALESVESAAERNAIAANLFSRANQNVVNTLALGEQGLRDIRQEIDDYGIAISRVDAAAVEAANDAITRAKANIQGLGAAVTVDLAPYIEAVANLISESTRNTVDFGDTVLSTMRSGGNAVGVFLDGLRGIKVLTKTGTLAFQAFGTGILSVFSLVQEGWARLAGGILRGAENIGNALAYLPGVADDLGESIAVARSGIEGFADDTKATRDSMIDSVAQTKDELHDMLMEPLPSQNIEQFFDDVEARAAEARDRLQQTINQNRNGGGGSGESEATQQAKKQAEARTEAERDAAQKRFEAIRESTLSQTQLEQEEHQRRLEFLNKAKQGEIQVEGDANALIEAETTRHKERLREIEESIGKPDQERFNQIRERLMTELEIEREMHAERMEFLQAAQNGRIEIEGDANEQIEKERERHSKRVQELTKNTFEGVSGTQLRFLQAMDDATRKSGAAQYNAMAGAFADITAAGARENKALFEINKAAGISEAIISTAQGVTKALGAYPPPLSFAMAASVAAAGAAQIATISSTSFGGGGAVGGAAAPSVAGGASAPPVEDVSQRQGGNQEQGQSVFIDMTGRPENERESIRRLAEQLNEYVDNGGRLGKMTVS